MTFYFGVKGHPLLLKMIEVINDIWVEYNKTYPFKGGDTILELVGPFAQMRGVVEFFGYEFNPEIESNRNVYKIIY